MITDEQIKQLAVSCGFKLTNETSDDLKPYVYEFARELIALAQQVKPLEFVKTGDYDNSTPPVKDAADIFIAMAEAAPAVEPAQSGWLRAIDEALVCHHVDVANASDTYEQAKDKLNKLLCVVQDIGAYFAKQEPAQAVPAFWASENILKESLRDNISCILTTTKCAANTVPLYTVPPAIDDETRHRLILVCEYLETVGLMFVSPRVISSQIRAILEAGE